MSVGCFKTGNMIEIIQKLNILLDRGEKRKGWILLLVAIVGAFFEMLGVSLTVPLMTSILEPDILTENAAIGRACAALSIESHRGFVILCILAMIAVFILKDLFLLFKNRVTAGFVYSSRFRMQQKMLRAFLHKPYEYYLTASSGEIIRTIRTDVNNVYGILNTLLSLISETVASLAIIFVIVVIDPIMTLLIAGFVGVIMLIIIKTVRPILREEGIVYRKNLSKAYTWMLQSIQGIKDIKIGGRETFFEERFGEAGQAQLESEKRYNVINSIPRILIEMGCICAALLAMLVMIINGSEPKSLVPSFAAFAMAAVKLMPTFSRVVNSMNTISYHGPALDRLLENISSYVDSNEVSDGKTELTLQESIELRDITYRYCEGAEPILEAASMTVPAGYTVGISGVSGAGKTTTADILLGLLKPETGCVLCDGMDIAVNYRGWIGRVSYIPQSIFLLDGSIRDNIVFGSEDAGDSKVWKALEDASLADFVRSQPQGLDTEIGERGIRLSGGQRQRLGIARALYSDPTLLVLDEATSSLDTETETAIMDAIGDLHGKKTMVIIAHRRETIENCDIVYRVEDKKLVRVNV